MVVAGDVDILLGLDIFPSLGRVVFENDTVEIGGKLFTCLPGSSINQAVCHRVTTAEDIVIPARTEALIPGTTTAKSTIGALLFEPQINSLQHLNLAGARTLQYAPGGRLNVRIVNPTQCPVTIPKNMPIGDLSRPEQVISCPINTVKSDAKIDPHFRTVIEQLPLNDVRLTKEDRVKFRQLLLEFHDVFAKDDSDVGLTQVAEHEINTGDAAPIRQRAYRIPMKMRDEYKRMIDDMAKNKIIRKSCSPWTAPTILVKKKDGSLRFVVDYRKLNAVTKRDTYPLPRIDEIFDQLGNNTAWFTTLDICSAYHNIPVKECDKEKTAFQTGFYGIWEYNRLPFGLTNAPSTFQRVIEFVLSGIPTALVYLDDTVLFDKSFDAHCQSVRTVLERFRRYNMKLKIRKCKFCQGEVTFLGHKATIDGILPDPSNVEKVKNYPVPTSCDEVRRFCGLGSYYRKYIYNYASIVRPLTQLLGKDVKFSWDDDCQQAFDIVKEKLITPPILAYPDFNGNIFEIQTDASNHKRWCYPEPSSRR